MSEKSKQRRTLFVLIGLFFLPLAVAFVLYYGTSWRPSGGSNHGELLQPVKQLPSSTAAMRDKWVLAYVGDGKCDDACRQALVAARQSRLLLNQEMTRVVRVLFATDACCDRAYLEGEHPGLELVDASTPEARAALLSVLPAGDLTHDIFIIDPRGNIVIRFDTRQDPRGLLADIKKLLKLSHIG